VGRGRARLDQHHDMTNADLNRAHRPNTLWVGYLQTTLTRAEYEPKRIRTLERPVTSDGFRDRLVGGAGQGLLGKSERRRRLRP
jgi:hypothetical protein